MKAPLRSFSRPLTGRGFGSLTKGEQITDVTSLEVGDVLLAHSNQFNADNTIAVTRKFEQRVWACFVNPDDCTERWGDTEFCIWEFDSDELYRAQFTQYGTTLNIHTICLAVAHE